MHSEFVQHFTRSLTLLKTTPISFGPPLVTSQHEEGDSNITQTLHSLLVKCQSALEPKDIHDCVLLLHSLQGAFVASEADRDESALEEAIVGQLTVALYANALDQYLAQATQVEAEAEWWTDMEDSTLALLLYLLQSMIFSLGLLVFLLADILSSSSFTNLKSFLYYFGHITSPPAPCFSFISQSPPCIP